LPNRLHTPTDSYVSTVRRLHCLLQRGVNPVDYEAKFRAARHAKQWPRVVRENEHRRVIRRLLAPPTFPALVRPGAADRTEHVPTKNPGTNADQPAFRNVVVDARFTTLKSLHSAPYARVEEPLHELGPTNAKWILKILARSGTEAVDGYRETLDAYSWHNCPLVGLICKTGCGERPNS